MTADPVREMLDGTEPASGEEPLRHVLTRTRLPFTVAALVVGALALGSSVSASPDGRTHIEIQSKEFGYPSGDGKFFFSLGQGGDLGKLTFVRCCSHDGKKTPDGIEFDAYSQTTSFKGRAGTLVIRSASRSYNAPGQGNGNVYEGTWSVVSAKSTGDYAGMTGRGSWIGIGTHVDHSITSQYSGYVRS